MKNPTEILTEALLDCADYFDARSDVIDGDYGVPEPSEEMRMLGRIAQALKDAGYMPVSARPMRHDKLCGALDLAQAALLRCDFVAADSIRNEVYGSGLPLSWFAAEEVGHMIAAARAGWHRRPTVDDLRRAS